MKEIGKKLQIKREAKGYTQASLARELGISTRMLQRYEEGLFPKYKSETIIGIDTLLGTNFVEMIYDKTIRPSEKNTIEVDLVKEYQLMKRNLIRAQATINILTVTMAEFISASKKKSIATISAELSKAISSEEDVLYSDWGKKQ